MRGKAYGISGNGKRAKADFIAAARLGDKMAQDALTSLEIEW